MLLCMTPTYVSSIHQHHACLFLLKVVTVVANDADDGINSRLTYSFGPAVNPELPFFIDGEDMLRFLIYHYLKFQPLFVTYLLCA